MSDPTTHDLRERLEAVARRLEQFEGIHAEWVRDAADRIDAQDATIAELVAERDRLRDENQQLRSPDFLYERLAKIHDIGCEKEDGAPWPYSVMHRLSSHDLRAFQRIAEMEVSDG